MAFGSRARQVTAPFSATSSTMMIWLAKHQQTIKWLVYALLLVNFGMYIIEDIGKFQRALSQGQSLLAATTRLATSLDLVGWFALLAIFEIESYWLRHSSSPAVSSRTTHPSPRLPRAHRQYFFHLFSRDDADWRGGGA